MNVAEPLIVSLYGGPGVGKSTTAAQVFAMLKHAGVECEMVREYAKDLVWGGRVRELRGHQISVFAEQLHRFRDHIYYESDAERDNRVEVVVTDAPILLASVYGGPDLTPAYHQLVRDEHDKMRNFNVRLVRVKAFNPNGRLQTEDEARELDAITHDLGIPWHVVAEGSPEGAAEIYQAIMAELGRAA